MNLRVNGHVAQFFPGGKAVHEMTLEEPASVREVLGRLSVNPQLVMAVYINNEKRDLDCLVNDGDEVLLLSPVSGG
ncbi:MAG: MoaD/ThiS family protein [Bacillota bacterium]